MADSPSDAPVANAETGEPKIRKRRLGVDPSLIISDGRSKRRRTPSPEVDVKPESDVAPKDPQRAAALGLEIYKRITEKIDTDGDHMADPFMKLPSKKQFPDYYETIKHPLSLEQVKAKLDKKEYDTLKDVVADLGQIFNNAKRYNVKESLIFMYAKKLHKMTRTFYSKVTEPGAQHSDSEDDAPGPSTKRRGSSARMKAEPSADVEMAEEEEDEEEEDAEEDMDVDQAGPSNVSGDGGSMGGASRSRKRGGYMKDGPTVYKLVKPVLKSIRDAKAKDGSQRIVSGIFETLPDRKDLPDYFAAIKDPISLQEIEERMVARKYDTWEEFFEQVELMCSNAMTYNEDESEVYRDAQQIKEILDWHRKEIVARLSQPVPQQKVKPRPSSVTVPSQQPGYANYQPRQSSSTPSAAPLNGHIPSQSPYGGPSVPPPAPRPPLPAGVISEDIVSSLMRYNPDEQRAWITSLTPNQLVTYRQIAATIEARRRVLAGQAPPPFSDGASAARARQAQQGGSAYPAHGASQPLGKDLTLRQKPPHPVIKHVDFSFTSTAPEPGEPPERHAIRLYNLRGIVSHHLIIGNDTGEIEVTAYIVSGNDWQDSLSSGEKEPDKEKEKDRVKDEVIQGPVIMLVKGAAGQLARAVYEDGSTGIANGTTVANDAMEPTDSAGQKVESRKIGYRWTLNVPKMSDRPEETRLELISTRPTGEKEVSVVYINRQP